MPDLWCRTRCRLYDVVCLSVVWDLGKLQLTCATRLYVLFSITRLFLRLTESIWRLHKNLSRRSESLRSNAGSSSLINIFIDSKHNKIAIYNEKIARSPKSYSFSIMYPAWPRTCKQETFVFYNCTVYTKSLATEDNVKRTRYMCRSAKSICHIMVGTLERLIDRAGSDSIAK